MFKVLTIQEKIDLVDDSLDRFSDYYQPASCDMCCGGGDEHETALYDLSNRLEEGENVDMGEIEDWLFEKK